MFDQTYDARLFQPLTLPSGQVIPNRIAKAAMEENMADGNQAPSRELKQLYKAWAEGKPGLLITGNVMIDSLLRQLDQVSLIAVTRILLFTPPVVGNAHVECRRPLAAAAAADPFDDGDGGHGGRISA